MKRERHLRLDWQDILLGITVELAYPVVLGLVVLGLAWLVVELP